jgi:hypothetical protein
VVLQRERRGQKGGSYWALGQRARMLYEAENYLPLLLNILANDISTRNRIRSNTVCSAVTQHLKNLNNDSRHIALRLTYWDTGKCTSVRNINVVAASMLLQLAHVFRCRGEASAVLHPTEFLPG